MSEQRILRFNPVSPVVHRNDPHTSTLSARRITKSGERKRQAEEVLATLRTFNIPPTSAELAYLRLDRHMVARRLPELADPKNGALVERCEARRCTVTGRMAITWRAKA